MSTSHHNIIVMDMWKIINQLPLNIDVVGGIII